MFFSDVRYRLVQFRRSLRPIVRPDDLIEAQRVLGPRLYPLFDSMQSTDQRHCLDVYRKLIAHGCTDADILKAALIHDAGKGRLAGARFGLHHRVAYVALERTPRLLDRLARHNRGLGSLHEHSRRTIDLAREYGASDSVLELLAEMDGPAAGNERARLLKDMDDRS
jgi:hypothetical protein